MAKAARKTKAAQLPSNEGVIIDQLVTPEARRHGDYRIATVSITEGEHGPAQKGEQSAVMNYGGSTVDRWKNSGALTETQCIAIALYRRAHNMVWGSVSYGSYWTRLISGVSGGLGGRGAETLHEAQDDLDRMDRRIFKRLPPYVYGTWRDVVLDDIPAGVAGGMLTQGTEKARRATALVMVRMVCDLMATEWGL